MTCQECELLLAEGRVDEAAAHLSGCTECRALAEELRANTEVFAAMREEFVPARPLVIRRRARWPWAIAAAAAIVLAIGLTRRGDRPPETKNPPMPVQPPTEVAAGTPPEPPKPVPSGRKRAPRAEPVKLARAETPAEPMMVKMLTSDPDVVIYWLVEAGE